MSYWVKFTNGDEACYDGDRTTAMANASLDGVVAEIDSLPYPASPRRGPKLDMCPSFCYMPESCKGRGSCPRPYACSE